MIEALVKVAVVCFLAGLTIYFMWTMFRWIIEIFKEIYEFLKSLSLTEAEKEEEEIKWLGERLEEASFGYAYTTGGLPDVIFIEGPPGEKSRWIECIDRELMISYAEELFKEAGLNYTREHVEDVLDRNEGVKHKLSQISIPRADREYRTIRSNAVNYVLRRKGYIP